MKKIKPHWQILGALVLATLAALILRSIDAQAEGGFIVGFVGTCKFVGTIFMNLLKMI
ncbi:MAG: dicarboxylate/amino acid:cation symporter, partial [Roseibacillus sp.]|nr:dicarboxylate/amino acid:cation symporter [Roseibacillus sp.]